MRPKYKVTGCARFFVFFIIFVPLVFFGAAYFRGENGLDILKNEWNRLTGSGSGSVESKVEKNGADDRPTSLDSREAMELCEQQLRDAQERIKELEEALAREKVKNQ